MGNKNTLLLYVEGVKIIKPILKYAGGKGREIKYFLKYFPEKYDRYVENFIGGGAVYFHLNPQEVIINDLSYDLINFYQMIQKHYDVFNEYTKGLPIDKDTYNKIRSKNYEEPLEQAIRYFYLNKTAYSGLMRYNSKGQFNTPYGNYKNPNFNISPEQIDLLKRTKIFNCDFRELPITYKSTDFIFIDPPYVDTWVGYGQIQFSDKDQEDLYQWFIKNPAQVMIVINKVDWIVEMYKKYIKDEYEVKYGIDVKSGNKKVKKHLIITNY